MSSPSEPDSRLVQRDANGALWFREKQVMWPGQQFSVQVKDNSAANVLLHEHTGLQDLLVFESESYGTCMALDGVMQITQRDEAGYQETITHTPLMAHPNPKRVLVVGGGDGGAVREVLRHDCVEEVVQCEIDSGVTKAAAKYLSHFAWVGRSDPRVTLLHEDAAVYVQRQEGAFDVVIIDSSDPVGPAETLFTAAFYRSMHRALRRGGILAAQGECMWLHLPLIADTAAEARKAGFASVDYCYTTTPTYPSGQIGFLLCGRDEAAPDVRRPNRAPSPPTLLSQLRYYSTGLHAASFVLPKFAEDVVSKARVTSHAASSGARAAGSDSAGTAAVASTSADVATGIAIGVSACVLIGALAKAITSRS